MRHIRWFRYWRRMGASEQEAVRATEVCLGRPFPRYLVSTPGLGPSFWDTNLGEAYIPRYWVISPDQARKAAGARLRASLNGSLTGFAGAALAAGAFGETTKMAIRCDREVHAVAAACGFRVADLEAVPDQEARVDRWIVRRKGTNEVLRTFLM